MVASCFQQTCAIVTSGQGNSPLQVKYMKRFIPLIILIILAATGGAFVYWLGDRSGQEPQEALIRAEFSLVNTSGKDVTQADFAGKPMLVFFGFTYCPDVCPTELMRLGGLLDDLGDDAEKLHAIMITIDPERDQPEDMKKYLSAFHPSIVGLTGTAEQIRQAASAFRVYYARVDDPDSAASYTMDHSALIYLMDEDGRYVSHFSPDTKPEVMLQRTKKLL